MNLRIEDEFILRLSALDFENLLSQGELEQKFDLSGVFTLVVLIQKIENGVSAVSRGSGQLKIALSPETILKLQDVENKKGGVLVDSIRIQVDLWSEKRRNLT